MKARENIAFFYEPPACPYYTYVSGKLSPYGDESIPLLRSIEENRDLRVSAAASSMYTFFKSYSGRLNHVPKLFMESHDSGKPFSECSQEDNQAHGIVKVPLIVAKYFDLPELLDKVDDVVNILQKSPTSLTASRILARRVIY